MHKLKQKATRHGRGQGQGQPTTKVCLARIEC